MDTQIGEAIALALLEEIDEDITAETRREHRLSGYFCVLRSEDYTFVRCCVPSGRMPPPPDPSNRQISKRGWERRMQEWRKALAAMRRKLEIR